MWRRHTHTHTPSYRAWISDFKFPESRTINLQFTNFSTFYSLSVPNGKDIHIYIPMPRPSHPFTACQCMYAPDWLYTLNFVYSNLWMNRSNTFPGQSPRVKYPGRGSEWESTLTGQEGVRRSNSFSRLLNSRASLASKSHVLQITLAFCSRTSTLARMPCCTWPFWGQNATYAQLSQVHAKPDWYTTPTACCTAPAFPRFIRFYRTHIKRRC